MKRRHILLSALTTAGFAFANISIGKKQTNAAPNPFLYIQPIKMKKS
jgi:hypothetical protein